MRELLDNYKATPLWEKVEQKDIDPVSALWELYQEEPYVWMEIVMNAAAKAVAGAEYGLTGNQRVNNRWARALLAIFSLPPSEAGMANKKAE